jgi:uncharacterized protein YidB (DUF937 family)
MSLFSDLAGAVEGSLLGNTDNAHAALGDALQNSSLGGVSGLLGQLNSAGLGNLVSSWTGGGQGQAPSVEQLQAALTPDHVEQIASSLGLNPQQALAALAQHLPAMAAKEAA